MNPSQTNAPADAALDEYESVVAFFHARVECEHEAKDLTQETFRRYLKYSRNTSVQHSRGLIFQIARNLLVDRSRQKTRIDLPLVDIEAVGSELYEKEASPQVALQSREYLQFARRVIATLPERCREVFILSRFGNLSYREIAIKLGISQSTVEKHMIRAIRVCKVAKDTMQD
ncbi:MAG: sigma-70 family RNA polymerase sigma factor [Verrucomicrobiota bacterium]